MPWFALAYHFERELHEAYAALGCLPPTYEPRATGHVPEMIEMIKMLIERGHAYPAADGSGDVYFDVQSWPAYGSLSGQRIDEMEAGRGRRPARQARSPRLRAVEGPQAVRAGHGVAGPTPWGRGRPGWHLECSAMAGKYLGDEFDIHGGGHRPALPAPRERAGPVDRRRPDVRPLLDAQRLGDRGRGEDEQVARQRRAGLGGGQAVPAPGGPVLPGAAALPLDDRVLRRLAGRVGRPRWPGSTTSSTGPPRWSVRRRRRCRPISSPR